MWLFWTLLVLAVVYCGAGAVLGLYEKSQTDDKFKVSTIWMWLPRMMGWVKGY